MITFNDYIISWLLEENNPAVAYRKNRITRTVSIKSCCCVMDIQLCCHVMKAILTVKNRRIQNE